MSIEDSPFYEEAKAEVNGLRKYMELYRDQIMDYEEFVREMEYAIKRLEDAYKKKQKEAEEARVKKLVEEAYKRGYNDGIKAAILEDYLG